MCSAKVDADALCRKPITGSFACCARAAIGHAAAPPTRPINSLRRIPASVLRTKDRTGLDWFCAVRFQRPAEPRTDVGYGSKLCHDGHFWRRQLYPLRPDRDRLGWHGRKVPEGDIGDAYGNLGTSF